MATYLGTEFADNHAGGQETQYGIDGSDRLTANVENRSYILYGGNGNDQLIGNNFGDELYGGTGNDVLYGDYGNDYLNGGTGQDAFVFDTPLNKSNNVDFIADFTRGSGGDLIWLSQNIFAGVGSVDTFLKSKKFEIGSDATSSKTRILYNENKATIFYTPDGSDGGKTKFANVSKGLNLDSDDFFIVA